MGLRINTNTISGTALRTLQRADRAQKVSLERLSTGLRINRASDDPSGLVISEQLRNQVAGIRQAIENSQNASNLIGTAEAALSEVHSLLLGIRESVLFALNSGGNDADQIDAEQDAVDNAIRSIDRVAQTTKFATRNLLDGTSSVVVRSQNSQFSEIDVNKVEFGGLTSQQYTLTVTRTASRANALNGNAYAGTSATSATVRITGASGTQDIVVASSFTTALFRNAINAFTADTGVFASANGQLYSVDFGSDVAVSVEVVSGTLNTAGADLTTSSGVVSDSGADLAGHLNGISLDAKGNDVRVVSDVLTAKFVMSDATTTGSKTFTVKNTGLNFQLNHSAGAIDREQVGIGSVHSSLLGEKARTVTGMNGTSLTIGGYLSSLVSGGANDLNTSASNALRILDSAIDEISNRRAFLGAFQSQTVDTNINSLEVAMEQLAASESTIRDLDFASESANYAHNQVLFQSSIAVLAQANQIPQAILALLS
ncbi:MAG: flagellin [Planctomycetota bacterium]